MLCSYKNNCFCLDFCSYKCKCYKYKYYCVPHQQVFFLMTSWVILTSLILKACWPFPMKLIQRVCIINFRSFSSDPKIQSTFLILISVFDFSLDFGKPQLNDSIYMFYNLKASNESAMMIEVFQDLGIIYHELTRRGYSSVSTVNVFKTGSEVS